MPTTIPQNAPAITPSAGIKKNRRWPLRIIGGLLGLIILLLAIFVLINLRDAQLTPVAQTLLKEPSYLVPDEQKSKMASLSCERCRQMPAWMR